MGITGNKSLIGIWADICVPELISGLSLIEILQAVIVLHCVDATVRVRVLAVVVGGIEDLVLPHVQVQ